MAESTINFSQSCVHNPSLENRFRKTSLKVYHYGKRLNSETEVLLWLYILSCARVISRLFRQISSNLQKREIENLHPFTGFEKERKASIDMS